MINAQSLDPPKLSLLIELMSTYNRYPPIEFLWMWSIGAMRYIEN
jgi:hypothetical protein